ncbi:putative RNA-directed DNA polymerase from transposon BS [Amphibalanus amphitrite]|uniref:Putative RNA-directed DNA polymerase from transposon BS n=1 Tax=Amphibalanus amphitrite TaxID=1232801 RepID=A0A6A4WRS7_AMPAM|nr:putative RNA-directed DNA polymerase from transposon BS [Amphibalanus amphitrite]
MLAHRPLQRSHTRGCSRMERCRSFVDLRQLNFIQFFMSHCFCDDECIKYGDCCLEVAAERWGSGEEAGSERWSCESLQEPVSVYMVSECPASYPDPGTVHRCRKTVPDEQYNHMLDLPVYSRNSSTMYSSIPRGARPDAKPWALDPELQQAVSDRQEARRQIRADDPASKERWIAAKRRAADVERSATQKHFRTFVEDNLNQPASLGRVTKILKKWEGAGDEHQPGQAMRVGGRLLVTDREKAQAFCATYAHVSRQVRSAKVDRACKRRLQELRTPHCLACENRRTGCCSEFTEDELVQQLRHLQQKKAPGPDGVSNEHLQHLGPIARRALLELINASWMEGAVPREWRRARIVPIPKAGKDRRDVGSYRPIALTSHLSKLVERLVLGRLRHIVERDRLVPAEQVGFRAGRSVEDSIGRLVQQVQDGWNLPKSRSKRVADGTTAQKYVLLAFDFARAYDTVDHRLLRVRLMEMGVPRCLYNWTWQFLRDRRATVEYQSATSGERVFRAGLPQGSVLSAALFLLWAAPLAAELQRVPGTTAFLYADDTAALCAGNDIQVARQRAQQAADTLAQWAQANKMTVAGQKTQALVLSQWPRDAANCSVKVAGETVIAGDQLKLLGVTLDRLLHFGPHCRSLRQRVRPRTAQLRKLIGREWGLQEQQLRVVASGYVRGALEHAAAAWLPAASPTHLGLLEVEMRAAARVVTGCPRSTPAHGLMAEAGLAPVAERRTALAARLLAKARALPEDDPLRTVADREVRSRLSTVSGWRGVGEKAWREAGIAPPISIEPLLPRPAAPWEPPPPVSFCLDVGTALPPSATDEQRRDAASHHLAGLPQCATWVWTDGSATEGVTNGGAGALIVWPDDETAEIRTPAGRICSSYRAEMVALRAALNHLLEHPAHTEDPLFTFADDLLLVATGKSLDLLQIRMQETLDSLDTICQRASMTVNPAKASACVFSLSKRALPPCQLRYAGRPIPSEDSVTHLGITLDKGLSFNTHVEKVVSSCTRSLGFLKMAKRKGVNQARLLQLYRSLVQSRLLYGAEVITATASALEKLDRVQTAALRIVTGCTRDTARATLRYGSPGY